MPMVLATPNRFRTLLLAVAALLLLACSIAEVRISQRVFFYPGSDMTAPLVGARAALQHRNPYSDDVTQEIQREYYGHVLLPQENWDRQAFSYPLHAVLFFAPLAGLSWHEVRILTLCMFPVLLAISASLWTSILSVGLGQRTRLWIVLAAVLCWPAIAGIAYQQPTVPVFAALTLACFLLRRHADFAAGALLAACTIKPQLSGLLLAWLLVWTLANRRFAFAAGFLTTLAALLAAAQWLVPGWFPAWRIAAAAYASGLHRPLFIQFFGEYAGIACMAALAAWILYSLYRIGLDDKLRPEAMPRAAALLLAATLAVTPANPWLVYNYVLLLPGLLLLWNAREHAVISRGLALMASSWLWLTAPVAVAAYLLLGYRHYEVLLPLASVVLPLIVTVALCLQPTAHEAN